MSTASSPDPALFQRLADLGEALDAEPQLRVQFSIIAFGYYHTMNAFLSSVHKD